MNVHLGVFWIKANLGGGLDRYYHTVSVSYNDPTAYEARLKVSVTCVEEKPQHGPVT